MRIWVWVISRDLEFASLKTRATLTLIPQMYFLASLSELCSLELSHNSLSSVEDVGHLSDCQSVEVLDLSHNKLEDPAVVEVFAKMRNLGVLCLTGNPVISKISNYRKTMICKIKTLNQLDQCPIFPRDRACAEAWYSPTSEFCLHLKRDFIVQRYTKLAISPNH